MKATYWIVALLTVGWPLAQLGIFAARFGKLTTDILVESLVFAPLGFVSSLVLVGLLGASKHRRQRQAVILGYAVASPFALLASLLGGLILVPIVGATVAGLIPLSAGMLAGYLLGANRAGRLAEGASRG